MILTLRSEIGQPVCPTREVGIRLASLGFAALGRGPWRALYTPCGPRRLPKLAARWARDHLIAWSLVHNFCCARRTGGSARTPFLRKSRFLVVGGGILCQ